MIRLRHGDEHHHEPVTQVLHLGPTRLCDRLSQDREVAATHLVGHISRQACANAVEPTTSVNSIVALSVLKNQPLAWRSPG